MQGAFEEYPKWMRHPAHQAAVAYKQPRFRPGEEGWGRPVDPGHTGKPERFPEVMVRNLDQEQYYASLGYVPKVGVADPEAYRREKMSNGSNAKAGFVEYPKMLYRKLEQPLKDGTDVENVVVPSRGEEEQARRDGWATLAETRALKTEKKSPSERKATPEKAAPPSQPAPEPQPQLAAQPSPVTSRRPKPMSAQGRRNISAGLKRAAARRRESALRKPQADPAI
jgi:hypothetical protein